MRHVSTTHRVAIDWLFDGSDLESAPGNWCETLTKIQPSTLKCGNSRKSEVNLHTLLDAGNLCEVRIHTKTGQKQSFVT